MLNFSNKYWKKTVAVSFIGSGLVMGWNSDALASQSVTLNWDPSSSANVAGYRVYYGNQSLSYTNSLLVGNVTSADIPGLVEGATYFFAAKAVDATGYESDMSVEASYLVPVVPVSSPAVMSLVTQPSGKCGVMVSGTTGVQYVVEAAVDLVHWIAVQTNVAPFTFVDLNAAAYGQRFYRSYIFQ